MFTARPPQNDQAGFASMVIAIALIIILSLMTVGFAELMRSNQGQALNKQLSAQAYYAAESGVNDAEKAISAGFIQAKSTCAAYTAASLPTDSSTNPSDHSKEAAQQYLENSNVGNSTGSSYPCLLINPTPTSVVMDVSTQTPAIFQMTGVDSSTGNTTPISEVFVSWQDPDGGSSFRPAGSSSFPPLTAASDEGPSPPRHRGPAPPVVSDSWGNTTGVLRMALTPLQSGQICMNGLESATYTTFLYPAAGSGTIGSQNYPGASYNCTSGAGSPLSTASGDIIDGNCNTSTLATINGTPAANYCTAEISGLNYSDILMDLRSIYQNTQVSITAYNCVSSACTQLEIKNAQYLIDSTGKAQGQLKRIQVRLPAKNTYPVPAYGLQTGGDICKQLQIYPNGSTGSDVCP